MSNGQWGMHGFKRRFYPLLIAHCALLMFAVEIHAATVYVAPNGNDSSCLRDDAARPCSSFSRAYTLAQGGDSVEAAAGTYPAQTLPILSKGASVVTFRPASGASVTIGDLVVHASYVEVRDMTSNGEASIASNTGGLPSDTHHVTFRNLRAKGLFIVAEDVLIQGGDYGGIDGCSVNNGEDIVEIWEQQASNGSWHAASRVTIDGAAIHDVTDHNNVCSDVPPPAQGRHVDCMQILSGHFITIRNSRFYNCATSDIIARPFRAGLNDLVIENNFFQDVMNPGASINMLSTGDTIGGVNLLRNNTMGSLGLGNFTLASGASFLVTGNILDTGSCSSAATYSYNVFRPGSATCGTHAVTGNPSFVGPTPNPAYMNGIVPNYRLAPGDTVAKDKGNPASYPATDIDGQARFSGAAPDAGADELGTPPSVSACDINKDSATTVVDVQLCANQAIGAAVCSTGDINLDGNCNVVDVQRVVNAALGGTCVTP